MKNTCSSHIILILIIFIMKSNIITAQGSIGVNDTGKTQTLNKNWSQDEEDVKATVDQFLIVAGNYDLVAMAEMMAHKASLAIARFKDGGWTTETMLMDDYFEAAKNSKNRPYYEPLNNYIIHVTEGHLAFLKADGLLHAYGIPLKNNIDYFTLIKENGIWKFVNLSFTSTPIPTDQQTYDTMAFAKGYAQAWCSQKPDFVASFFSEDGSLSVNNGDAAVGRTAITEVAKGFMDAFPDMIVTMDRLLTTPKGFEFHWTLTGTNTGPNGTGKKVKISGFEIWQLDENGLIKKSKGSFDSEEYNRQLKFGAVD